MRSLLFVLLDREGSEVAAHLWLDPILDEWHDLGGRDAGYRTSIRWEAA